MSVLQVLKNNQLATKEIHNWCTRSLISSFSEEVPSDIQEEMLKINFGHEKLAKIIESQPRSYFDFFDEQQLYIEIKITEEYQFKKFQFVIDSFSSRFYNNRRECEKDSIIYAIELLENKLNKKHENN